MENLSWLSIKGNIGWKVICVYIDLDLERYYYASIYVYLYFSNIRSVNIEIYIFKYRYRYKSIYTYCVHTFDTPLIVKGGPTRSTCNFRLLSWMGHLKFLYEAIRLKDKRTWDFR